MMNPLTPPGCIALYDESPLGTCSDVSITGNLLGGAGYTMCCGTESGYSSENMTISGNWFSTLYYPSSGYCGTHIVSPTWGSSGNVRSGNVWYSSPSAGAAIAG
jgi:hypothetical protein